MDGFPLAVKLYALPPYQLPNVLHFSSSSARSHGCRATPKTENMWSGEEDGAGQGYDRGSSGQGATEAGLL